MAICDILRVSLFRVKLKSLTETKEIIQRITLINDDMVYKNHILYCVRLKSWIN